MSQYFSLKVQVHNATFYSTISSFLSLQITSYIYMQYVLANTSSYICNPIKHKSVPNHVVPPVLYHMIHMFHSPLIHAMTQSLWHDLTFFSAMVITIYLCHIIYGSCTKVCHVSFSMQSDNIILCTDMHSLNILPITYFFPPNSNPLLSCIASCMYFETTFSLLFCPVFFVQTFAANVLCQEHSSWLPRCICQHLTCQPYSIQALNKGCKLKHIYILIKL